MPRPLGRNGLRSLCAGLAVCALAAVATPARAGIINFDPDGAGAAPAGLIAGLDFSVGNVLAPNLVTTPVGGTFDIYYQSALAGVITPGGITVAPPGLNGAPGAPAYEITAVSRATARVTAVAVSGSSVLKTFQLNPVQVN